MSDQLDWLEEELQQSLAQLPPDEGLQQVADLVTEYQTWVREEERLLDEAKEAGKRKRYYGEKAIPEALSALGLSGVTLDTGQRVTVEPMVYVDIKEENRPAAHRWMEENGYGELIKTEVFAQFGRGDRNLAQAALETLQEAGFSPEAKESVHPQTLRAWANDLLVSGTILPDFFGAYLGAKTKIK